MESNIEKVLKVVWRIWTPKRRQELKMFNFVGYT